VPDSRPFVAVTFLTDGTVAPGLVANGLNPLQVREALERLEQSRLQVVTVSQPDPQFGQARYLYLSAPDGDAEVDRAQRHNLSNYQLRAARHFLRVWADAAILGFLQVSAQQAAKRQESKILVPVG